MNNFSLISNYLKIYKKLFSDEIIIPHPELMFRKFVLLPFCELIPDYHIEKIGSTISELLSLCPDKSKVVKHIMEKNA